MNNFAPSEIEFTQALERAAAGAAGAAELCCLLQADKSQAAALFAAAYKVKLAKIGAVVSLRGLVECGNQCRKDCYYCGIRRSRQMPRQRLGLNEIVDAAKQALDCGYGSIALQAGEQNDPAFIELIEAALLAIQDHAKGAAGVTLSLGEQDYEVYERWRLAGATRYLLRLETSDAALYQQLHPQDGAHLFARRLECLRALRTCGYQVGSGVMINLPGQTAQQLAADLVFLKTELDIDMLGMGPFIPHSETPLGEAVVCDAAYKEEQFFMGLKMIASARLLMPEINIAATTALEALHPKGREKGLKAGANVLMPSSTPLAMRPIYKLYNGKPQSDKSAQLICDDLTASLQAIGETPLWRQRGDSLHYKKRLSQA